MDSNINYIANTYNITKTLAYAFLIKTGWSEIEELKSFDEQYILKTFNFSMKEAENRRQNNKQASLTCGCCYEDVRLIDMIEMPDCAHRLCSECFRGYCKTKVNFGQAAVQASCPDSTCNNIVPQSIYKKLLGTLHFKKYQTFLKKQFVDL